jgi:hypothetical protein
MFPIFEYRGYRYKQGVSMDSAGYGHLMKRQQYLPAERGELFAERFMNVCSRINSTIEMPCASQSDRGMCYPVSIVLMPRNVPFVVETEMENGPLKAELESYGSSDGRSDDIRSDGSDSDGNNDGSSNDSIDGSSDGNNSDGNNDGSSDDNSDGCSDSNKHIPEGGRTE